MLVQPNLLKNQMADVDLYQRNYIIEGVNGFDFVQENEDKGDVVLQMRDGAVKVSNELNQVIQMAQNPVENPPMNNWSVHQPSPPHDHGMSGKEDLGMNMIVNGTPVSISQVDEKDLYHGYGA